MVKEVLYNPLTVEAEGQQPTLLCFSVCRELAFRLTLERPMTHLSTGLCWLVQLNVRSKYLVHNFDIFEIWSHSFAFGGFIYSFYIGYLAMHFTSVPPRTELDQATYISLFYSTFKEERASLMLLLRAYTLRPCLAPHKCTPIHLIWERLRWILV